MVEKYNAAPEYSYSKKRYRLRPGGGYAASHSRINTKGRR